MHAESNGTLANGISAAEGSSQRLASYEPRCGVCTHPQRARIESLLCSGVTATRAAEMISDEAQGSVSRNSVSRHLRRHMAPDSAMRLLTVESHAVQLGEDLAELGSIVTPHTLLGAVMREGFAQMVRGEVAVRPADMIKAAQLLMDYEAQTGEQVDMRAITLAFHELIKMASRYMDESETKGFARDLGENPVLAALYGLPLKPERTEAEIAEIEAWAMEPDDPWDDGDYDD